MATGSSDANDSKKKSNQNGIRSGFLGKTGTDEAPIDTTYYDILNVSPTASSSEIKRAYYTLSLQYHPDRTQNLDTFTRNEYAERFKHISQAYSILSDPEKRTLYNRFGKDERLISNDATGFSLTDFDAEEFFRLMFGGEAFKDIIGDFELAKTFNTALTDLMKEAEQSLEQAEAEQRRHLSETEERRISHEERIQHLSTILISKLDLFINASSSIHNKNDTIELLDEFSEKIRLEIPNLLEASYGEHLLHSIGYVYSSRARFWLSKMESQDGHIGKRLIGFGKHVHSSWSDRIHVIKETVKTVKSAVQWTQSMSKLAQINDEQSTDENEQNNRNPFQHHTAHLEYSGNMPTEVTPQTASASPLLETNRKSPTKHKNNRKSSVQPPVPLTEEEKRKIETDTTIKSLDALWRATKLEIESVEREVCDRVLNDSLCPRDIRRLRCMGLSRIGHLYQEASSTKSPS